MGNLPLRDQGHGIGDTLIEHGRILLLSDHVVARIAPQPHIPRYQSRGEKRLTRDVVLIYVVLYDVTVCRAFGKSDQDAAQAKTAECLGSAVQNPVFRHYNIRRHTKKPNRSDPTLECVPPV